MKKGQENKQINEAVELLLAGEGRLTNEEVFGKGGIIKQLTKALLEKVLKAEMEEHLWYSKYGRSDAENARNGSYGKSLISEQGIIDLEVPRYREGSFEPIIVAKKQTRISGLDQKILTLYAKGMSLSDIKMQLLELYDTEVSESLISKVTEGVMDDVRAWQNRPLESVYPVVFFDCLVVKVRQNKQVINKAIYVALGIDLSGQKDILGLWISENEGAKFWLANFTELKNRGMKDMLITASDNLTGMSEAIIAVYPKCDHQLCIVHQIRNSLKYVSYKERKAVSADLKYIYQAKTEDEALLALENFEKTWGHKYPQIIKSWYANWSNLAIFLAYPEEIRKIIYTTNAVESLNSQLGKVTNNKRVFSSDDSVFKSLYLTISYITANISTKWTMPVQNWNIPMAHFLIKFDGRI